jgi:hypothetical protein
LDRPVSDWEWNRRVEAGDNETVPFNHLVHLGLIELVYEFDGEKIKVSVPRFDMAKHPGVQADVVGDLSDYYVFTDLADSFVEACRAPKTIDASSQVE